MVVLLDPLNQRSFSEGNGVYPGFDWTVTITK